MGYTQHLFEGSIRCHEWYHMLSYLELNSVLKIASHMQGVTNAQTLTDIQIILVFFISIFLAFHLLYIFRTHHYIKWKHSLKIIC